MGDKELNEEQFKAYDYLINKNENVFLTGSAGTGKSFVLRYLIQRLQKEGKTVAVTSTTGISALLIDGITLHSWSGINIEKDNLYDVIISNYKAVNNFRCCQVLIIDEISMLNPHIFYQLEEASRLIRNNKKPFGGIQLLLCGDFCQLPVVKGSGKFIFEYPRWELLSFKIVNLKRIYRQNDQLFSKILNKVRLGDIDDEVKETLNTRIMGWNSNIIDNYGIVPTLLFSTKKNVKIYNNKQLDNLLKKGNEYREYYVKYDVKETKLSLKQLINLKKFLSLEYEDIIISIGSQVMLTVNLSLEAGLANGSRGVVIKFTENKTPIVRFRNGVELEITNYKRTYKNNDNKIIIEFMPLKLSWATTIHKSQGATLDYLMVDLSNIFEYGQAYVALSRASSLENMYIYKNSKKNSDHVIDFNKIICHPKAKQFYHNL